MKPPQKDIKEPHPEPKSRFVPITAIAVVIILIVTPAWVFLPQLLSSESDSTLMELNDKAWKVNEDLQNFLYYNASETIVTENSRTKYMGDQFESIDIVYLESLLNQAFNDHINDVYQNERSAHKVDITDYEIQIGIDFYNTNDRVQNISINVDGDLNTYKAGEFGTTTSPVYYKLYGEFTIKVTDRETDKSIIRVLTFNKSLRVPEPFYLAKLNEFQNNANTEVSDIGRMVRYMLNTVARYRAKVGYGQAPFDSPRNILNEGDVELAVNLAVILEEALLFRAYDHEAVQALDSNYFELSEATRAGNVQYNPTGKRIWGEAEISNYIRYVSNLPGNRYARSLTNLIDKYVEYDYIDPADLLVMYMCLDNEPYPGAIDVDPKDELSVLEDEILLNPRDNYGSSYDVSNLDYVLTINLEESFEFWRGGDNEDLNWSVSTEKLEVDHQPNYLIAGSEQLSIENIYPPRGWYTNIDLNNVQCGNLTPSGTRCPARPPP
ncbi:MAG: hypothetical protein KAJ51_01280, partial [Thermoplasmata archaeon]|nr:hypothetical protein [Thermoplasmata archaeon]